ncbi:response regulator [Flavobacterium frigoris]|uniref:histidine kinase n=1 Tax=Flavobacterium frigoris (strain PS1) TaxID=1086011 RepID=H7FQV4_FLAFP|nr:response regulator [Flavobacterium frigoris]EIA09091.1 DNA-binding response regulator [Flavobacterium frigoris PS1]
MNKNKILLVDDEINLRETISELLIHENYIVKTASNGQEALNILDSWIPDLIISDIMMPIMDGNMFHQLIKENIDLSSIPFIFMTAMNGENQMRKCLTNGADDFITKPFKIDELIEIVKNKIERFNKIKNAYSNIYIGNKISFLHEINTPLNGILAPIDLLIENEDIEKEDVLKFYEAIKISGERLNRTLQNIMLYQNVKSNILKFEDNSYAPVLDIFLKVKSKIFEVYENQEKRITYAIDKADVKISQENLSFILFELIDNALKFSPHNTIVMVSGSIYNQEFYELVIKDFGIGFSENELNRIGATQQFNREQQEQQGLGLGLFLSRIIIKKIKGVFSIRSKEKEGTTIKILLPLNI